jgi:hypothetical protein
MFLPSLGLHFVAEKCKNFHLLSYDDNFLEQYHLLFWQVNSLMQCIGFIVDGSPFSPFWFFSSPKSNIGWL